LKPIDLRMSARRREQPQNHPQRRCLAGAIRAEQAIHFASAHAKRHMIDGQHVMTRVLKPLRQLDGRNHLLILARARTVGYGHDTCRVGSAHQRRP
jgi:hypothetical protein